MAVDKRHMRVADGRYKGLWSLPEHENPCNHGELESFTTVAFRTLYCDDCGGTWKAARHFPFKAEFFCPLCGKGVSVDPIEDVPLSKEVIVVAELAKNE